MYNEIMLLPLLSAIFLILAFNTSRYFLIFFALIPLFLFFNSEKIFWRLLFGTAVFRLIFALGTAYFIIDPILYFLSILIFLGLPISFFLIRKHISSEVANFFLPFLWVFWDYLEAQYTALPMTLIMLGDALGNSPFLGLARLWGIIGLTFFVALVNFLLTFIILKRHDEKKWQLASAFLVILMLFANVYSLWAIKKNRKNYSLKNNILEVEILSSDRTKINLDKMLTSLPLNQEADLLIVAENFYKSNLENSDSIINFYKKSAKDLNINLSAVGLRKEGDQAYKSSFLFSKGGEISDVYDKNNLTITSEYWPFKNWRPFYFNVYLKRALPAEKRKAIFDQKYQLAKGRIGLIVGGDFSFAAPICLEFHYPGYLEKLNKLNPDFIIHNSNNDWITLGLGQYLMFTNNLRRIEAVHFQKPVLVSGIKDYAGVFYPDGTAMIGYPENGFSLMNVEIKF